MYLLSAARRLLKLKSQDGVREHTIVTTDHERTLSFTAYSWCTLSEWTAVPDSETPG